MDAASGRVTDRASGRVTDRALSGDSAMHSDDPGHCEPGPEHANTSNGNHSDSDSDDTLLPLALSRQVGLQGHLAELQLVLQVSDVILGGPLSSHASYGSSH